MRWIYVSLICLLIASPVEARRISRPQVFSLPWTDEQVTSLNNVQEDIFLMQKGRYELDIVTTTKTDANNGEIWIITTGGVGRIQYKSGDHIFTINPSGY